MINQNRTDEDLSTPQKYILYVDDNFHYMDESSRLILGRYDTEVSAIFAAQSRVNDFLEEHRKDAESAQALFKKYVDFGEDPWIDGSDFSAWNYARMRCEELYAKK